MGEKMNQLTDLKKAIDNHRSQLAERSLNSKVQATISLTDVRFNEIRIKAIELIQTLIKEQ